MTYMNIRCPKCNKTILLRVAINSHAVFEIKCRCCKTITKCTIDGAAVSFETVK